jgi:FkbM family methyltransferase
MLDIITRENSPSDQKIVDEIFKENVYRLHDYMYEDKAIFLDIGANIGVFTLYALERAYVANKRICVYAIEPEPHNLNMLKKNLIKNSHLLENDSQVFILELAVGDREDIVTIDNNHGGSRIGKGKTKVSMTTLDKILKMYKIDKVDFMKMDIEGSEIPSLLAASDETIDKIHFSAIEFDEQNGLDKFSKVINRFARKCSISTLGVPSRGCYLYSERHI